MICLLLLTSMIFLHSASIAVSSSSARLTKIRRTLLLDSELDSDTEGESLLFPEVATPSS